MNFIDTMFSDGATTIRTYVCNTKTGEVWFGTYRLLNGVATLIDTVPFLHNDPDTHVSKLPTQAQERLAVLMLLPVSDGIPGVGYRTTQFVIISRKEES